METLKYRRMTVNNMAAVPGNAPHSDSEVDSLLLSSCWSQSGSSGDYLLDSQKLILENSITSLDSSMSQDTEIATKATMDALDSLLLNSQPINANLAELKPLPPFTNYTGHLSINGIQGHHYHAIAQRIPEENNNTYNNYTNEHNIVSSSTCISADSLNPDSSVKTLYGGAVVEECADSVSGVKLEYSDCVTVNPDSCVSADSVSHVKNEMGEYDISSIEDIAAIIGSAIADTTVPSNNQLEDDPTGSRDSWMDLDAWIGNACVENSSQKNIIISQEGLSEFILPHSPHQSSVAAAAAAAAAANEYCVKGQSIEYPSKAALCQQGGGGGGGGGGGSTLQSLLTHGYMPLLQNRLQNGPPVKQEAPSSTSYGGVDLISTSSPPANVVSTTDSVLLNGRYIQQTHYGVLGGGLADDRMRSPDLLGQNYPHTTTTSTPSAPKKSRNRSQKKQQQQHQQQQQQQQQQQHQASSSTVYSSEQSLGLLGKEKPVHRCNICNRGFLNKSNIKVHLRTHTGEKPFRCETCAKAFRQKAHLIKHQQIHKRIGRD